MAQIKGQNDKQVITNEVRFSYVHLFEPVSINESDKKKYSISLLIKKEDKETLDCVNQAIENAKNEGLEVFGGKMPKSLKLPLRDGDEDRDDEAYKGHYFINANSYNKPGVIDSNKIYITDEEQVYSGCYGLASISFYAFNSNGNKGIACGLNNIMKTRDGEPLSGGSKPEDDFAEAFDVEDDFLN